MTTMKKTLALLALTIALVGCGSRHASHGSPSPEVAALMTIDNNEGAAIDVYLDFEFVGHVPAFEQTTFAVFPGVYDLQIDEHGDGEGLFHYTTVDMYAGDDVFIDYDITLADIFIDVIFD